MKSETFQNKYRIESARASWHDYNDGIYFITICTKNYKHFFGKIENGTMRLSKIGEYAFGNMQNITSHYPYIEIPLFVVMPNHIHAIVIADGYCYRYNTSDMCQCGDEARLVSTARATALSIAIGGYKSAVTKFANENNIDFAWQKRFHDRIVRNQNELNRIADYIENNPGMWKSDLRR